MSIQNDMASSGLSISGLKPWLRKHPALFNLARSSQYSLRRAYGLVRSAVGGHRPLARYCEENSVRKLHIGCGDFCFGGWFNTDAFPRRLDANYLDATGVFPYPDRTFDFVFNEHMIEHISLTDAQAMLREIFRVLRPGGVLRIATPDLDKIIALKSKERTRHEADYLDAIASELPGSEISSEKWCFAFNHLVRAWGHTFIYDSETLAGVLRSCGFSSVKNCALQTSIYPALNNLEHHGSDQGQDFNAVETMVLEATK